MILLFLILVFAVIVYSLKTLKKSQTILNTIKLRLQNVYENRPSLILPKNYFNKPLVDLFFNRDGRDQYESLDSGDHLNAKIAYLYLNNKQDSALDQVLKGRNFAKTKELVVDCIANLTLPGTLEVTAVDNQSFPNLTRAYFGNNYKHLYMLLEKYNNIFILESNVVAKYKNFVVAFSLPKVLIGDIDINSTLYDVDIGGQMIVEPDFVIVNSLDGGNFLIMEESGLCMKIKDSELFVRGEFSMPYLKTLDHYRAQKGLVYSATHWVRRGFYKIFQVSNREYIDKVIDGKSFNMFKVQTNVYALRVLDSKDIP